MSVHAACGHDTGYHDPCSKCHAKGRVCTLADGLESRRATRVKARAQRTEKKKRRRY